MGWNESDRGTRMRGRHKQGLRVWMVGGEAKEDDRATLDSIPLHPGGSTKHIIPDFLRSCELPSMEAGQLRFGLSQRSEVLTVEKGLLIFSQGGLRATFHR